MIKGNWVLSPGFAMRKPQLQIEGQMRFNSSCTFIFGNFPRDLAILKYVAVHVYYQECRNEVRCMASAIMMNSLEIDTQFVTNPGFN